MCLIEVWTFSECRCRFDRHIPCHPSFSRPSSPARAQHGQIKPLPTTPPPSRSANDGDYAWSSYAECDGYGGVRQCSVRHIEHRTFREPICDDCLLEELGLNKSAVPIVESIENGLDGEEWLLESNVEIQIDQASATDHETLVSPLDLVDDMPTPRVGTGFESLGDGDADDEGELDDDFRGRINRRSAIDINRDHLSLARSWSNWDLKPRPDSNDGSKGIDNSERRKTAISVVRKVKETELRKFTDKAKRSLRLTITRAKTTASKARSDTSRSPTKTGWESESSGIRTPTVVTKIRSVVELRGARHDDVVWKNGDTGQVRTSVPTSQDDSKAHSHQGPPKNGYQLVVSSISIPPDSNIDTEITTPTSISSSAAHEIAQSSPTKWDDHLRQDLGERLVKQTGVSLPFRSGSKSDLHFDADKERRRLLSSDTTQSVLQISRNISSSNWVGLDDGTRLDEELANSELEHQDEQKRLLSTTTIPSLPDTESHPSSSTWEDFPREVSTTDMDASIPDSARPFGHAHRPSTSSITSFTTSFSPSPQTSPSRPSPRMRQNLSFHPLTTMLQIETPSRPNWSPRNSSFHSPPLRSPYRLGLETSQMRGSSMSEFACVHDVDCCAICGDGVGGRRVISCVCAEQECQALKPMVRKVDRMEVCDHCN